MKKRIMLLLFMSFLVILSACGDSEEETEKETKHTVIPVETADIKQEDLIAEKVLFGQTQPIKQTPVIVSQPGELIKLEVSNGDNVKKGDPLAVIESTVPAQPQPIEQPPAQPAEMPGEASASDAAGNKASQNPAQSEQQQPEQPAQPEQPEQPAEDEIVEETIEAPSKGTVASLSQETGTFVSSEAPLMMLANLDKIKVSITTTQKTRTLFKKDQEVSVEIDNKTYTGKVLAIDPLPNENGEYVLDISVDNENGKINPGEAAEVTLEKTLQKDKLIVPSEAVITTEEESYVYIIKDSRAKKVKVDILETQTEKTAVKGELKKGNKVVIKGQTLLSNNINVDVKNEKDKDKKEDKKETKDKQDKEDEKDGNES
ncbi:MAG TPA: efflux RND transporter periplasmic adaptor subunit [Pseudogracilibacillus sp.]|nr:efflux RND transporter periplasmic adaptor subunit [Pseudogracilibacillus sp.]